MLETLFQIVIYPLYALIEILFHVIYNFSAHHIGITILLISFVVSLACLPLYLHAEALQKEEEKIQEKLSARVNSIKKNFKGDEKHLLLQTYYRQNNYHPVMALRLSFSLLLQIPFFLAAYLFFHNLTLLSGMHLGAISDLAKPDGLMNIGGFSVNLLPLLMTLINIAAGFVYAKDKSFSKNIQLYLMSFVFLVLLYNSPSGLVLYWTFNNCFSLIKNIVLKCLEHKVTSRKEGGGNGLLYIFLPVCLGLWLLWGVLIPSNVVATSPVEFCFPGLNLTAFNILGYPSSQAFGLFILWCGCIYYFTPLLFKKIFTFWLILLLGISLINVFALPLPKANLTGALAFSDGQVDFDTLKTSLEFFYSGGITIFTLFAAFVFCKKRRLLQNSLIIVIAAMVVLSGINLFKIHKKMVVYNASRAAGEQVGTKVFNFSKEKKNVLIIFLDRAISSYFPLVLEERPELKEIYTGFTYYPNTVSFFGYTMLGYPPILGGYEYTPLEIHNKDSERTFFDKYNEGVAMLPRLFKKHGWNAVVTDTPGIDWNYEFIDTDQYQTYGVRYKTLRGNLGRYYFAGDDIDIIDKNFTVRNLLYFSFMTSSPADLRKLIYDEGHYLNNNIVEYTSSYVKENYAELYYLPSFTDFSSTSNSFIVINNDLPHDETLFSMPDYTLERTLKPGESKFTFDDNGYSLRHFHVNAAALMLLGKYFKFLKDNDVWDNTRIIIVADHGRDVVNPNFNEFQNDYVTSYNPLLLVKDFNAKGEIKTSPDFMTNADVPFIAAQGLIANPVNPFTGMEISTRGKEKGVYIKTDHRWRPENYEGKSSPVEKTDTFHFVKDDIFNKKNWTLDIPVADVLK